MVCVERRRGGWRKEEEVKEERRGKDVVHKLECSEYFTCYYIEWRCVCKDKPVI